jgi:hypothetical protein
MRPTVNDITTPCVLRVVVRHHGVDGRERDPERPKEVAVIFGHRVVATDEDERLTLLLAVGGKPLEHGRVLELV